MSSSSEAKDLERGQVAPVSNDLEDHIIEITKMGDHNIIMLTMEIDNLIKEMEDHIIETIKMEDHIIRITKVEDHKVDMEEDHLMKKV